MRITRLLISEKTHLITPHPVIKAFSAKQCEFLITGPVSLGTLCKRSEKNNNV